MSAEDDIGDDGGSYDIPPEQPNGEGKAPIPFEIGDIVATPDRDNIGEVIGIEPGRVHVRLTNKFNGSVSELFFPPTSLELLRRQPALRALNFIRYRQMMGMPTPKWLIKHVFRCAELGVLYAPPAAFKTFIALLIAYHVATGRDWCGRRVTPGVVIYIAAEGLYSIRERTKAWVQQFVDHAERDEVEKQLEENFIVLGDAVSFIEPDFERLIAIISALAEMPVLIIVDTLARCMAGGDENSAKDMGLFVRACDRLRALTGAAVLVVHHAGKSDERSERGSSALRGGADAMLLAVPDDSKKRLVRLECEKQKEGDPFDPIYFELHVVEIGYDEDNEPRKSGRLIEVDPPANAGADEEEGTVPGEAPDDTLQRVLAESFFEDGAATTAWQDASRLKRATFFRARKRVVDAKLVSRTPVHGHPVYRLTEKSRFYRPPPPPPPTEGESQGAGLSPSITSLTGLTETDAPKCAESQVSVPPPPLGGDVGRDCDSDVHDARPSSEQDSNPKPKRTRKKKAAEPESSTPTPAADATAASPSDAAEQWRAMFDNRPEWD